MYSKFNISENDLLNYVFFTDLLSEIKISYIKKHENKFEQIKLYINQREEINQELKKSTKVKIANKIPAYNSDS